MRWTPSLPRSPVGFPGLAEDHLADRAVRDELRRVLQKGRAAGLRAHLHHTLVLAGRGDHPLPFDDVVAVGLLDVDVLSRLAGMDRRDRVPVVGGPQDDGVKILVVQEGPVVLRDPRLSSRGLLDPGRSGLQDLLVQVGDVGHRNVLLGGEGLQQRVAAAAHADDGDVDPIGRLGRAGGRGQGETGPQSGAVEEKSPAVQGGHGRTSRGSSRSSIDTPRSRPLREPTTEVHLPTFLVPHPSPLPGGPPYRIRSA